MIRGENTNLKKTINNLEKQFAEIKKQISEKEKIISELETEKKNLKIKLEEVQKQNDILNSHSINININNVTGTNNKNSIQHNNNINNIENIKRHVSGKYPNYFNCDLNSGFIRDENKNKYFPYKKINSKILNNKNIQRNALSNTKNESSEKTKSDYLNKGNRKHSAYGGGAMLVEVSTTPKKEDTENDANEIIWNIDVDKKDDEVNAVRNDTNNNNDIIEKKEEKIVEINNNNINDDKIENKEEDKKEQKEKNENEGYKYYKIEFR